MAITCKKLDAKVEINIDIFAEQIGLESDKDLLELAISFQEDLPAL